MRQVTRKGLITVAAAGGVLALGGGYAHADAGRRGRANSRACCPATTSRSGAHPGERCAATPSTSSGCSTRRRQQLRQRLGRRPRPAVAGRRAPGLAGVGSGNNVQAPVDVPVQRVRQHGERRRRDGRGNGGGTGRRRRTRWHTPGERRQLPGVGSGNNVAGADRHPGERLREQRQHRRHRATRPAGNDCGERPDRHAGTPASRTRRTSPAPRTSRTPRPTRSTPGTPGSDTPGRQPAPTASTPSRSRATGELAHTGADRSASPSPAGRGSAARRARCSTAAPAPRVAESRSRTDGRRSGHHGAGPAPSRGPLAPVAHQVARSWRMIRRRSRTLRLPSG